MNVYQLRWFQEEAVNAVYEYFAAGNIGNPVVALPTGTGKSFVIAELNKRILQTWPTQRILNLTHVKELIEQNGSKLKFIWPYAPMGIYSAGLKQRDTMHPIIFGGVMSIKGCDDILNRHWDLVFIDECHLISPKDNTTYRVIFERLRRINPHIKIVGFTATAFRLGQGMITEDGLFTDICYDMTGPVAFNRLITEGFLSKPVPRRTRTEIDVSGVAITNGEFNAKQLEEATDNELLTYEVLKETCENGHDRRAWLIFCAGVSDAEHTCKMLNDVFHVPCTVVHSKLSDSENDRRWKDFKAGKYRAICNMNKLTTGTDHPPIDLIVMKRATMSPVLWVQMVGRGTRPSPETFKENCLVLDFARNTPRLGPINDPKIPQKPGKKTAGGSAPVRICDVCGTYNHARATECLFCGADFETTLNITANAGIEELVREDVETVDEVITEMFEVIRVTYNKHCKAGSAPSMQVTYMCRNSIMPFREWVCLEHAGFPGKRARDWWKQRNLDEPPFTTDEALQRQSMLRAPKRIRVWLNKMHNGKAYPEVIGCEF